MDTKFIQLEVENNIVKKPKNIFCFVFPVSFFLLLVSAIIAGFDYVQSKNDEGLNCHRINATFDVDSLSQTYQFHESKIQFFTWTNLEPVFAFDAFIYPYRCMYVNNNEIRLVREYPYSIIWDFCFLTVSFLTFITVCIMGYIRRR